ncbi:MAG: DNA-3-methyladenine glycosylase I [Simkaniaceae bacterium]|nr:DNA-3-methyladenine glycosylase I [Simkaniaceae bacterium]
MENNGQRCFGTGKEFYEKYHDQEWGVPVHDDRHLFEMLCLEGAQAGLSWETVLKRREGYRRLFHQFKLEIVARMTDSELEEVLKDPAVIRNRRKVFSVRENARVALKIQEEFGSFDTYLWGFVNHKPIVNHFKTMGEVPSHSEGSDQLSRDLKRRGMVFVGATIIYAFMQAVGMVNDHLITCRCRS